MSAGPLRLSKTALVKGLRRAFLQVQRLGVVAVTEYGGPEPVAYIVRADVWEDVQRAGEREGRAG